MTGQVLRPFYYRASSNFGDHCNAHLWERLFPESIRDDAEDRLMGVGSILQADNAHLAGRKVVFGSGCGYGTAPPSELLADWRVYFVRGPRTAQAMGLAANKGIVDGAWLFGLLDGWRPSSGGDRITFVPHKSTHARGGWEPAAEQVGVDYVSPLAPFDSVIQAIANSRLVIAESLHAASFADLLRVPWCAFAIDRGFSYFKWLDWFDSVEVSPRVVRLTQDSNGGPDASYLDLLSRQECEASAVLPERATGRPVKPAGFTYRQLVRARSVGRRVKGLAGGVRRGLLSRFMTTERHIEQRAGALRESIKVEPRMSSDSICRERLGQLAAVVEEFKSDLNRGTVFPP